MSVTPLVHDVQTSTSTHKYFKDIIFIEIWKQTFFKVSKRLNKYFISTTYTVKCVEGIVEQIKKFKAL